MKLDEVFALTENQKQRMDEAPYGIGSKLKDKGIGGLKSIVGGGQREQGNIEAGEKANEMMQEFKLYIGKVVGRGQKTVSAQHLIDFLEQKGVNADKLGIVPNDTITPKKAQDLMLQAARETYRPRSSQQQAPQSQTAPRAASQSAPQQQAHQQTDPKQQEPEQQAVTDQTPTSVNDLIDAVMNLSYEEQAEFAQAFLNQ